MKHLTDAQLTGLLDEALPAPERAAAEAHLADCDACRARLADASALDESLGRALAHDPGDAYFADFAERVGRRIATGSPRSAPEARKARTAARTSPWSWLSSPRGLTLAGSTAALLVTAGLAWMRFHAGEGEAGRALHRAMSEPRSAKELQRFAADSVPRQTTPPAASAPPIVTQETRGMLRARRVPPNGAPSAGTA